MVKTIKTRSFTDTLLSKVDESKDIVLSKYFKVFINSKQADERELIYAKLNGLTDIIFELKKAIRGEEK